MSEASLRDRGNQPFRDIVDAYISKYGNRQSRFYQNQGIKGCQNEFVDKRP